MRHEQTTAARVQALRYWTPVKAGLLYKRHPAVWKTKLQTVQRRSSRCVDYAQFVTNSRN